MWNWTMAMTLVVGLIAVGGCADGAGQPRRQERVEPRRQRCPCPGEGARSESPGVPRHSPRLCRIPRRGQGCRRGGRGVWQARSSSVGRRSGYCDLSQATIGLALGGHDIHGDHRVRKQGCARQLQRWECEEFAGQASAVGLKAGSGANAQYRDGVYVFTVGEQGLMLEASIGTDLHVPAALKQFSTRAGLLGIRSPPDQLPGVTCSAQVRRAHQDEAARVHR